MFKYDFENKSYDINTEVQKAKQDKDVALWLVNQMSDFDITKVFVKAWAEAMDEIEKRTPVA